MRTALKGKTPSNTIILPRLLGGRSSKRMGVNKELYYKKKITLDREDTQNNYSPEYKKKSSREAKPLLRGS